MAPLPPESTARFWLDYNDGNNDHSMLFRYAPSAGLGAVMNDVHSFLNAVAADLYAITVVGARAANSGSTVSVPETWTGNPVYGTGAQPAVSAPLELCWVGRTTFGKMAKWFLYGFKGAVPADYRFFPGVETVLDDGTAVLRAACLAGRILAIDGQLPSVYPYVNIQWNSYWESQARR